jgi:branched-chain amino acid transport system permease protein
MYFAVSGNAVISVMLGGMGTLVGAIYGSVLLVVLKSIIGSWTEHHLIVIGVLFMICVMFMPKGLIGVVRLRIEGWLAHEPSVPSPAPERRRLTPAVEPGRPAP